jgi:nucleotide-binding universal stress UspA family protein
MIQFTKILCPIDFSDGSIRALTYAAALSKWYGAPLHIVHVAPAVDQGLVVAGDGGLVEPSRPVSPQVTAQEIRRVMDTVGATGVAPDVITEAGRTHELILQRARDGAADLIVMGTHGRGGFNRLLLGSVTEKVLRAAPCPVLTVPAAAPAMTAAAVAFKRILCPIDFSSSALAAFRYALTLARESNGQVTVIYALEYLDPDEPCDHVEFDIRRRRQHFIDHARARLHALVAGEDTTWCDIQEEVAIGRAYQVVLRHATAAPADLIVMGAQGTTGVELMLYGSNTQHVVRGATCPVLTVRS